MRNTWARWGMVLMTGALNGFLFVGVGISGIASAGGHAGDVHLEPDNATVYTNQTDLRVNGTIHNNGDAAATNLEIQLTTIPDGWYSSKESINRLDGGEEANFTLYLDISDANENAERDEKIYVTAVDQSGEVANSSLTVSLVHPPVPREDAEDPPESDGVDDGAVDEESRYKQCLQRAADQITTIKLGCEIRYNSPVAPLVDSLPEIPKWVPLLGE